MGVEIRSQVELLNKAFKALGGTIKVQSIKDVAELVAKINGFNSWTEFVAHKTPTLQNNNKITTYTENKSIENKVINKKSIKKISKSNSKESREKIKFNKKTEIPYEFLIGHTFNEIAKQDTPIGLRSENTLFIGANNKIKNIMHSWLLETNQVAHYFGVVESKQQNLNAHKDVNDKSILIGPSYSLIDPIAEMFNSNDFTPLFPGVDLEHNAFYGLWIMLVKFFYDEFNQAWSSLSLLASIEIEMLLRMLHTLQSDGHLFAPILYNYLRVDCGMVEDGGNYIFSSAGVNKHMAAIVTLKERLISLNQLYEDGFFKSGSLVTMDSLVYGDKSVYWLELNSEKRDSYWDYVSHLFSSATKRYAEKVEGGQGISFWAVWFNVGNYYNRNNNQVVKNIFYVNNDRCAESYRGKTEQIVVCGSNRLNSYWFYELLCKTPVVHDNLFYAGTGSIRNEEDMYLWRKKLEVDVEKGLEDYELIKFKCYFNLDYKR